MSMSCVRLIGVGRSGRVVVRALMMPVSKSIRVPYESNERMRKDVNDDIMVLYC